MPNIKSAKKRVLVNEVKRVRNKSIASEVKTAIKKFNAAIDSNNIELAQKLLPSTMSVIDSAVAKGIMHKNNAAGKKSALSKRLHSVVSGKVVIEVKKDNKTIAKEKALIAKEAREALRAENTQKALQRAALKEEEDKAKKGKKPAAKAADKKDDKAKEDTTSAKKSTAKKAAPKAAASKDTKKPATKAAKSVEDSEKPAPKKPAAKKTTKKDDN